MFSRRNRELAILELSECRLQRARITVQGDDMLAISVLPLLGQAQARHLGSTWPKPVDDMHDVRLMGHAVCSATGAICSADESPRSSPYSRAMASPENFATALCFARHARMLVA